MVVRFYSSVAPETTLSAGITNASTSIQVGSVTGFPTNTPYTLALDYEGATEELVQVNGAAGTTLTVTRAVDGTSAASHNAGARVRHVSSARDFADSRNHENSANGVHGLAPGEDLVGTDKVQTLSNKTFINATGSLSNITVNNVGNNALKVVGDPANPTDSAITVQPDTLSPVVFRVLNNGQVRVVNAVAIDPINNQYRIRVVKSGGTDIFAVLSGGSVTATLNNGADGYGLTASLDDVTRQGFFINSAASALRAAIYTNGTMDLNCSSPTNAILDIKMAAGQTGSPLRILDSGSTTIASITAAGTVSAPNANLGALTVTGPTTFTPTLSSGSPVFTAASGWTTSSALSVQVAGMTTIVIAVTRSGGTITPDSPSGNLSPDVQIGTVASLHRPNALVSQALMGSISNAGSNGTVRLNTDGTADFVAWTAGVPIDNTTGTYRFTFTYPS